MKKKIVKTIALGLVIAMLTSMMTMFASAASTVASGDIGAVRETKQNNPLNSSVAVGDYVDYYADDPSTYDDSVKWTLDTEGTLTFTGNGAMPPCRLGQDSPFNDDGRIKTVVIKEGIQQIGPCLLYGIPNLTTVIIEDAGTKLSSSWLRDCPNINAILYGTNLKGKTCSYELVGTSVQEAMGYPEKTLVFAKTFATYGPWYSIVRDDSNVSDTFSAYNTAISYNEMLTRAKTALANVPADVVASMPNVFQPTGTKPVTPKPDQTEVTVGNTTYVLSKGITDTVMWGEKIVYLLPAGSVITCTDGGKQLAWASNIFSMDEGEYLPSGSTAVGPYVSIEVPSCYWWDSENWEVEIPTIGVFAGYDEYANAKMTNTFCVCEDTVPLFPGFSRIKDDNSSQFTDVKADAYYAQSVAWAVKQGITKGTTETAFSPDRTCSNAHILTFLWRAYGSPVVNTANTFTDVSEGAYYYQAAQWAKSMGMVSGDKFAPDAPCSRASSVIFMWKAAGSPTVTTKTNFTDIPANADYAMAVAWALENGVTKGTSNTTFTPDATCTRAQIVTFLWRDLAQ